MEVLKTDINDVILVKPKIFKDSRGSFKESYREENYKKAGIDCDFVQDNLVFSVKNVFRGFHFQLPPYEQAKLITVIKGEILDIIVDLRKDSDTFLKMLKFTLSEENGQQLFVPTGFAHSYYTLSDETCVHYKVSAPYAPDHQSGIIWNDKEFKLHEIIKDPIVSDQDKNLPDLDEILSKYDL